MGGGVMGCSLAYQLACRGVGVVVVERSELGSQSTARNAGGVRQQFSNEQNVRLQMLSTRLLAQFEQEIGVTADFRQVGYLFVLTRPPDVANFRSQLEMWHRVGLAEARWLDADEAGRLVPVLNTEDVVGCTFCPTDGIAGPAGVTAGYAAAARRHGARLLEGVEVIGIEAAGGKVTGVRTSKGEIATPVVFDCAGAWAGEIGRLAGIEVPVKPYRRHIFVTGRFDELPREAPMTVDFATSFYFHPEGEGVLFGMSDREEASTFSQEVDWSFLERTVEVAAIRAPLIAEKAAVRTAWAGLYETTPDHQAILGPAPSLEGFWCACGFSGHGFMQAPAAGLLLAQLLTEGRSEIDLSPFSIDRFAQGELVAEGDVI